MKIYKDIRIAKPTFNKLTVLEEFEGLRITLIAKLKKGIETLSQNANNGQDANINDLTLAKQAL